MATANSKSRAQVDTVKGVDAGFASLGSGSALSMFIGSTGDKGKFNLTFILSESNRASDFDLSKLKSKFNSMERPARFGEML